MEIFVPTALELPDLAKKALEYAMMAMNIVTTICIMMIPFILISFVCSYQPVKRQNFFFRFMRQRLGFPPGFPQQRLYLGTLIIVEFIPCGVCSAYTVHRTLCSLIYTCVVYTVHVYRVHVTLYTVPGTCVHMCWAQYTEYRVPKLQSELCVC